jgi:hypothetical protein
MHQTTLHHIPETEVAGPQIMLYTCIWQKLNTESVNLQKKFYKTATFTRFSLSFISEKVNKAAVHKLHTAVKFSLSL